MIVAADTVVTMDGRQPARGAVLVQQERIVAVGEVEVLQQQHPEEPVMDLGRRILMPGLINAHCHLDYTMMRKAIAPQKSFTQWIRRINALKRSLDDNDYLQAIRRGFEELQRWGTTTVLNIEAFPELMLRLAPPPIRTWWFYELIDIRQRYATEELVSGVLTFFRERPDWLGGFGLSPHAPYTASVELYALATSCAERFGMPFTTHVAESAEEKAMFCDASGELYDFLESLGRDMSDCGRRSPYQHLAPHVNRSCIFVHMNELSADDLSHIAHGEQTHVVHCPRSHKYFGHTKFPLAQLRAAGANVCLGTDSLASTDSLSLFAEMQKLAEEDLTAEELVEMVTCNPAAALGHEDDLGVLKPGAFADIVAIDPDEDAGEAPCPFRKIVENRRPVPWMMVNGTVAISDDVIDRA